ncbi:5462_t:CDS:1, partial [Cetraspora pellucida]
NSDVLDNNEFQSDEVVDVDEVVSSNEVSKKGKRQEGGTHSDEKGKGNMGQSLCSALRSCDSDTFKNE